jgi:hypothetical protein
LSTFLEILQENEDVIPALKNSMKQVRSVKTELEILKTRSSDLLENQQDKDVVDTKLRLLKNQIDSTYEELKTCKLSIWTSVRSDCNVETQSMMGSDMGFATVSN